MKYLAIVVAFLSVGVVPAFSQSPATGFPPFGSFQSNSFDTVNLQNLNVHFDIPVYQKAGRGVPFRYVFGYDSSIWSFHVTNIGGKTGSYWYPVSKTWGWHVQPMGLISYGIVSRFCGVNLPNYNGYDFIYIDPEGTSHSFPKEFATTCIPSSGSIAAIDGSGYTLVANVSTNPIQAYVVSPSGIVRNAPICSACDGFSTPATGPGSIVDSNGNEISMDASGTNYTDTLGTTVLSLSGSAVQPTGLTYTSPKGTPATVSVTYKSYPIQTSFTGIGTVTQYSGTASLVDTITLPDNTAYHFTYEPSPGTTNGSVTARIASVSLPTGGSTAYVWGGFGNASDIPSSLTRTTPDSSTPWTYTAGRSVPNQGQGFQSTVTDPLGNQTLVDFGTNAGLEYKRQVYSGSSSGTPLVTQWTCYDGTVAPCINDNFPQAGVITETTKAWQYASNGQMAQTNTFYNGYTNALSIPTEIDQYGYASNAVGPLQQKMLISYASLGNFISNRPSQVVVQDGANNQKSKTTYAYDEYGLQSTNGTPQQVVVSGSRGNPTTVNNYVTTSSTLTKHFWYYDTGNVYQAQDVNAALTTFTYGACGNSFPTSVSQPLSLSESMTWNCTGGVRTSSTDPNGKTTYTNYTQDPSYWRPESTKDALGNVATLAYTGATQVEAALNFNSSTVDALTTLDSLGRPFLTQKRQAPGSSNFDTVTRLFDADGRPFQVTMPCVKNAGIGCSGASVTSTFYDGLGRVSQTVDSGNGTVNLSYPQNDVYSDIVAPAGENDKRRQLEYDALGRLTSVCEILTSGGTSCGQNSPASGYKTSYAYSVPTASGSQLMVTQGTQTRTYIRDGLGRVVLETNPETNNMATTYTFDTDATCNTANGGFGASTGDLMKKVDPNGNVTCFGYDALHRNRAIVHVSGPNASTTADSYFAFDSATVNGVAMTNTIGRLAEAYTTLHGAGLNGSKSTDEGFSYTTRGELSDAYQSTPHSGGYYHTSASYLANGALLSLNGIPGYTGLTYGVDGEGRLSTVQQGTTKIVCDATCSAASTTFDPAGKPLKVNIGGTGDNDTYAYDPSTERMSGYTFTVGATPKSMAGGLTWNQNGTLRTLAITDGFNAGGTQTCNFGTSSVTGYDDLGRLISINCGSAWAQAFSYDQFGNITKSGSLNWACIACYNSNNQYNATLSPSISYDANGNLLNDTFHTYTWDADNHPLKIDSTTCGTNGTCLTYDASGRMVEKNVSGTFTEVIYSPLGKTAIMSGQTTNSAYFPLPAGETLFESGSSGATKVFWHKDWLGSARFGSSISGRSSTFDRAFAPFGETYANFGSAVQLGFTGDTQDTVAGTYDTPNREQNPSQARWISPDPAGMGAVDSANPQSWNRYAYVGNNPMSAVDPTGLTCHGICSTGVYADDTNTYEHFHGCFLDGAEINCNMLPGHFDQFDQLAVAFQPTGYIRVWGSTLVAETLHEDFVYGEAAKQAIFADNYLYENELDNYAPVYGNISLLSRLFLGNTTPTVCNVNCHANKGPYTNRGPDRVWPKFVPDPCDAAEANISDGEDITDFGAGLAVVGVVFDAVGATPGVIVAGGGALEHQVGKYQKKAHSCK